MTQITWDNPGDKIYETGLDRGVLYLPDGTSAVWNGLTGVVEDNSSGAVTPYYMDGVKYLDSADPSDYSATLTALTYPDAFLAFDGVGDTGYGLLLDNQPVDRFGLTYRTLMGNDTAGINYAYRIHLLCNMTAVPTNKTYATLSDSTPLTELSWTITGVPDTTTGFRPTCHMIIDTRDLDAGILPQVEALLYGTASSAPQFPAFGDLKTLLLSSRNLS